MIDFDINILEDFKIMFSYYLMNTNTNEIVIGKWSRLPSSKQLDAVRKAFSWHYDDNLTLSGYGSKFHLIGNTKLIHDGKHFYPSFIEDRTYSVTFDDNTINQIRLLDSIDDVLQIVTI